MQPAVGVVGGGRRTVTTSSAARRGRRAAACGLHRGAPRRGRRPAGSRSTRRRCAAAHPPRPRRQPAVLDRPIDDLEHLEAAAPDRSDRARSRCVAEAAGGRAVRQPALVHRLAGDAPRAPRRRAPAAARGRRRRSWRCEVRFFPVLWSVTRSALPSPRRSTSRSSRAAGTPARPRAAGSRGRGRVAVGVVGQAERQLEALGQSTARRRATTAARATRCRSTPHRRRSRPATPARSPAPGRRTPSAMTVADRPVEHLPRAPGAAPPSPAACRCLQQAQELGLDLVEQAAAGQRIEALQRRRLLERRQAVDGGELELVRAGGEALQRGERVRPRGEALRRRAPGASGRRTR